MPKPCPQCGYEGTKTHKQILALYRKHFGDLPIWEMVNRRWINGADEFADSQTEIIIALIKSELMRFFEVTTEEEYQRILDGTWHPPFGVRVCRIEPERIV